MNKLIKGLLLFTALLLPVLIFVFLKMFGKNQFDIPVYNHTKLSKEVKCDNITTPHVVGELRTEKATIAANHIVNIYHLLGSEANELAMRGLMKVNDRLDGEEAVIHSISESGNNFSIPELSNKYQIGGIWHINEADESTLTYFVDCELMITGNESLVLVDKQGRIRGYYNGANEEETDRLILESKILLYGTKND